MIYFDDLPLSKDILEALSQLKIEYVFQPIFYPDGKTIYAREALMRPYDKSVTELIEEYTKDDKLHILEVATLFGATQAFILRGYEEILSINSFPCEIFSLEEVRAFIDYFGRDREAMILETLEYPSFDLRVAKTKRKIANISNNQIAIDDFGTGLNQFPIIEDTQPNIVKIDRSLITNIENDPSKRKHCLEIIETFHSKNLKVIAEGIETAAEFEIMKELGADFFQGFYLGMPE